MVDQSRVELLVRFTTRDPLAIAGEDALASSDRPVLRDDDGHPVILGTAVAGSLRRACRNRYGGATERQLFGHVGGSDAVRSPVLVGDARHRGACVPPTMTRDSVGIDRRRGAARQGAKFDEELWPVGLPFELRLDLPEHQLPHLMGTLVEWASVVGGVGSGPCRVDITAMTATRPPGIDELLEAAERRWGEPGLPSIRGQEVEELPDPAPPTKEASGQPAAHVLRLSGWTRLPLRCAEPLDPMGSLADDVEATPANRPATLVVASGTCPGSSPFPRRDTAAKHDESTCFVRVPIIPGPSLLGVVRSSAEHQLERVLGVAVPSPWDDAVSGWTDIVETFGVAADGVGGAGAVRFTDVQLDVPTAPGGGDATWHPQVPELSWPADVFDLDAHLFEAPAPTTGVRLRHRRTADRLTQGTYEQRLWTDAVLAEGLGLTVEIVLSRPSGSVEDADVALVAPGLRDLACGQQGVGGGTRTGYGVMRFDSGRLTTLTRRPEGFAESVVELEPDEHGPGWPKEGGDGPSWTERIRRWWSQRENEQGEAAHG